MRPPSGSPTGAAAHGLHDRWLPVGVLALAVLLILGRAPQLILAPRLWAEEGTIYFAYASGHPWFQALVHPHLGYFALWPNLATVLAAQVPLLWAPAVTTGCALLVQLLPPTLIATSTAPLFRGGVRRLLGVLIVVLAPMSGEGWLNSINSQFFFALAACLVLLEPLPTASPLRRLSMRWLLGLAGLTGPVTGFLLPIFLLRAVRERGREARIHAAILGACALVQGGCIVTAGLTGSAGVLERLGTLGLPTVGAILGIKAVLVPLGGFPLGAFAAERYVLAHTTPLGMWMGLGWLGGVVGLGWLAWRRLPVAEALALVGGFVCVTLLSIATTLGEKLALVLPLAGQRYFLVPSALVGLLLLALATTGPQRRPAARTVVAAALLGGYLLNAVLAFPATVPVGSALPQWRAEVAHWERDPQHALQIWPPGWEFVLPARGSAPVPRR
jgi:hypothetical protein